MLDMAKSHTLVIVIVWKISKKLEKSGKIVSDNKLEPCDYIRKPQMVVSLFWKTT